MKNLPKVNKTIRVPYVCNTEYTLGAKYNLLNINLINLFYIHEFT